MAIARLNQMKRSRPARVVTLLLAALCAAMVAAGWRIATYTGSKALNLQHSTRMQGTGGLTYYKGYEWASNGTVLQVDTEIPSGPFQVTFRDAATGLSLPPRTFPRGQETGCTGDNLTHVSPDHKWILYTGFTAHTVVSLTGPPRSYQTRIDCLPVLNKPDTLSIRAAWTRDSSHWLELTKDNRDHSALLLHRIDGSVKRRFRLFDKSAWLLLIGVTKRNKALIQRNMAPAGQPARFQLFDLDLQSGLLTANTALNRSSELQRSDGGSLVLSPQGDRLAWVTRTGQSSLESVSRLFRRKPQITRYTLFSADIDGMQLKPADTVETTYPWEMAQTHWTPDGKRISFVVFGAIYTVPVEFKEQSLPNRSKTR